MVAIGQVLVWTILVGLVGLHTVIAAVAVRFFRLRLATRWGPLLYAAVTIPVVYVVTTLVVLGVLGVGGDGVALSRDALVTFVWGLPLATGVALEFFWMPDSPEDLPERS
ncbi:MAG: hypothetical protein ABEJ70_07925 [Halobacteriaceae archaeon]